MSTDLVCSRYLIVIVNGTRNPHRSEVAMDVRNAVLKTGSTPEKPATYYSKEEQAVRLTNAFEKWETKGGVWSAAARKVMRLVNIICITHRD